MPWDNARPKSAHYDSRHAAEARRRSKALTEHDPCGWCHRPLGPRQRINPKTGRREGLWHLPHNASRTAYLPGMWHARCNVREAAIRARAMQNKSPLVW